MQIVVYADVLIFLNSIITLMLLLATSELFNIDAKKIHMFIGAVVGGFFSLILFAPSMGILITVVSRVIICIIIVLLTFRVKCIKMLFKAILGFLCVSFLFAGIMYGVSSCLSNRVIVYNNGYVYFNFSVLTLIICCGVILLFIKIFNKKFLRKNAEDLVYNIKIEHDNKESVTLAYFDTGNNVTDIFTGKSVILVDVEEVKSLFDLFLFEDIKKFFYEKTEIIVTEKMRLIPVKSLGETKMIPVFTCDRVTLWDDTVKKIIEKPVIGITNAMFNDCSYKALINESVLWSVR